MPLFGLNQLKCIDHDEIVGFDKVRTGFDKTVCFGEHEADLASWACDVVFQLLAVHCYAHNSSFCSQYANFYDFGVVQMH